MKKAKTTYITILSIITVVCIIAGTFRHVIGRYMGRNKSFSSQSSSNLDYSRKGYSDELESFDKIEIDASVMDINIQVGERYHLDYDCVAFLVPNVKVENHSFKLEQPDVPKWGGSNNRCTMTLTIPSDAVITSAEIDADVGDMQLADVSYQTLHITTDVGNISLTGVSAQSAKLSADVGDITGDDCVFERSEIEEDAGDITFKNSNLGNGNLEADSGNVDMVSCKFTDMDISVDAGNVSVSTGVNLSGTDPDAYGMELDTDGGIIMLNGKRVGQPYHSSGSANAHKLKIQVDTGDIEVNQEEVIPDA